MSDRSSLTETSVVVAVWYTLRSVASRAGTSWVMTYLQQVIAFLRSSLDEARQLFGSPGNKFEEGLDISIRVAVGHRDSPDEFTPDVVHHFSKRESST